MATDYYASLRQQAQAAGIDPDEAVRIAQIESSGIPTAGVGTSHQGLFQLSNDNWKKYGDPNASPTDAAANTAAWIKMRADNVRDLESKLGRPSTAPERYLAHQQGPAGAAALLQNPDAPAADTLSTFYQSPSDPTGTKTATLAITGNGGSRDMTGGQFAQHWQNMYNGTPTTVTNVDGVGAGGNGTMAPTPDAPVSPAPAGLPPALLASLAQAQKQKALATAMAQSQGLLAAGAPQQQAPQQQVPMLQQHRGRATPLPSLVPTLSAPGLLG